MTAKLNKRQQAFCEEYLLDLNGTQAAIRAGYSSKTAYSIASELLKKPEISEYITELLAQAKNKRIADATEVLEYLSSVLRGETQSEVVVVVADGDFCTRAEKVRKSPDEKERLKAAELLAKRYGLLTESVSLSGESKVEIVNDIPKNTD